MSKKTGFLFTIPLMLLINDKLYPEHNFITMGYSREEWPRSSLYSESKRGN